MEIYTRIFYKITSTFDEIFAQSQLDKKRLEFLTKRKINFIGNLKFSSIEKINDEIELIKFKKKINNFQVINVCKYSRMVKKKFLLTL